MNRKLLPYEHQLIEALGVTEAEYLEFVAIQQEYEDPKLGTQLDVRNDMGVTAIVLTVVGILFQVGAALLAPKPSTPEGPENQTRNREQRFAPTFGFNSAQELASYGDPINLIYTNKNQNPNGGVRASGSLVWSGIENFGSTQFMTLLFVMGASRIRKIKEEYTAFGQIGLQDFDPALVWMFYKNKDGGQGPALFDDIVLGYPDGEQNGPLTKQLLYLPDRLKRQASDDPVCRILTFSDGYKKGFSQAYSPTTSSAFGVYDPVPIKVKIHGRDERGDEIEDENLIFIQSGRYGGTDAGESFTLTFRQLRTGSELEESISAIRQRQFETIDFGGTYILGSAQYTLEEKSTADIANTNVTCKFICIKDGNEPFTEYSSNDSYDDNDISIDLSEFIEARNALNEDKNYKKDIAIIADGVSYDFTGETEVTWNDENGNEKSYELKRFGSIEYTERIQRRDLANPEKLITDKERKRLINELKALRAYRRKLNRGEYDEQNAIAKDVKERIKNSTRYQNKLEDKKNQQRLIEDFTNQFIAGDITRTEKNRGIRSAQETIAEIDEILRELNIKFVEQARDPYIKELEDNNGEFRGLDKRKYTDGGIEQVEEILDNQQVASDKFIDQRGQTAINNAYEDLLDEKEDALKAIRKVLRDYKETEIKTEDRNKNFYTKCLVKAESASYETVSGVDLVKFSIKSTVYRRIAGRQKQYGEVEVGGYTTNDNGIHSRLAFFEVSYKEVGSNGIYQKFPFIFAVRSGTESELYNQINFEPGQFGLNRKRWQFKFTPVVDIMADSVNPNVGLIIDSGDIQMIRHNGNKWWWRGEKVTGNRDGYPEILHQEGGARPRYTNQNDMFSNHSDTQYQFSFDRGPELSLTAVTEQQIATSAVEVGALDYPDVTTMAMIVRAGRGIQDLRNITTFIEEGKSCFTTENFNNREFLSSSFAPDIFVDTAIDPKYGVGKYIRTGSDVLDQGSLQHAKDFCRNNNLPCEDLAKIELFMDGIIADVTSWRSFWVANAPFSLLELARKNGRDTLVPALPTRSNGQAATNDGSPVPVKISALFTTGNIIEGTFKEEFLDYGTNTEDLIADVIYRELKEGSVFPRKATVQVRANGVSSSQAIRETFDASAYVTQREQAIMIGKLLVNQRRFIQRGIEFKTFPSRAALEPGEFIYVDIGNTSWDKYSSGILLEGGKLNSPLHDEISNGTYSFLLYDSTEKTTVSKNSVSVSGNTASSLSAYEGWMFVMGEARPSKRVFRITEVAFDEEGEVTVKGLEYPVYDDMGAKIADFRSANFEVR